MEDRTITTVSVWLTLSTYLHHHRRRRHQYHHHHRHGCKASCATNVWCSPFYFRLLTYNFLSHLNTWDFQKGSEDGIDVTLRIASFLELAIFCTLISSLTVVLWVCAIQQQPFIFDCAFVSSLHDSFCKRKGYISCLYVWPHEVISCGPFLYCMNDKVFAFVFHQKLKYIR